MAQITHHARISPDAEEPRHVQAYITADKKWVVIDLQINPGDVGTALYVSPADAEALSAIIWAACNDA
jgi:hypothetical protein